MAKFIAKVIDSLDLSALFLEVKKPKKKLHIQRSKQRSDIEAMRSDWTRIGKDMEKAIKNTSK